MAGNSRRRGARRNPGSKKGPVVGSGGQRRRGLQAKGATPKAEERPGHPAARRTGPAARGAASGRRTDSGPERRGDRTPERRASRRTAAAADGRETIAGRNAVLEAMRAGVPASTLWVAERIEADDRVREVLRLAAERRLPQLETPRAELDRVTGGAVHQGVALAVPPYEYAHPDDLLQRAYDAAVAPLIVALDGVTDPRNLGAVVRSTAAFGGHGVVVAERRSAGMTATAWKASAGAAARLPVARATNLTRQLRSYANAGLAVVGLDAGGSAELGDLSVAADPLVLVIGAEGRGLSRLVAETCQSRVCIAMAAEVESLNAGVAAGIVLHEVARARRQAG